MLLDEIVQIKQEAMAQQQRRKERKERLATSKVQENEEEDENNDTSYADGENAELDLKEFVRQWEKEFDFINSHPEDNSDFDSDNDINPLDTLNTLGEYTSKKTQQITSENTMKRRPI